AERDVLPRAREQVVEPRSPEALPQVVVDSLVFAEHDAEQDRTALAAQAESDRARQPPSEAVAEACNAAAAPDRPPSVAFEDDVHAVPPQPSALVESVLGPSRENDLAEDVQDRAFRRRAAERQPQQGGLVEREASETPDLDRCAKVETAPSRRSRDDDD